MNITFNHVPMWVRIGDEKLYKKITRKCVGANNLSVLWIIAILVHCDLEYIDQRKFTIYNMEICHIARHFSTLCSCFFICIPIQLKGQCSLCSEIKLCYVMLCYVMLCYVTLRYVTLRYVIFYLILSYHALQCNLSTIVILALEECFNIRRDIL